MYYYNNINNYQNIINQKDVELNNFRAQLNNNINIQKNVNLRKSEEEAEREINNIHISNINDIIYIYTHFIK